MNIREIKDIADSRGINLNTSSKLEIIHAIQLSEGNKPCFLEELETACGVTLCPYSNCRWYKDCAKGNVLGL